MKNQPAQHPPEKEGLHPRNPHRFPYDFEQLVTAEPGLAPFVLRNAYGTLTIDFSSPEAVLTLNRALLKFFYGVSYWEIPRQYLCPPIPGRADYLHYAADLLGAANAGNIPHGSQMRVLDVGVGANGVYPIIGHRTYGWQFVGSDIDPVALASAQRLVERNENLWGGLELRLQPEPASIFQNIVRPGEFFDLTMCNPPFHASPQEARQGTQRKWRNLGVRQGGKPILNFGGQQAELWCPGGEERFVRRMVQESAQIPVACYWFTSLISKKTTLPAVYRALKNARAERVQAVDMAQGQKSSRFIAWTFLSESEQAEWRRRRWTANT